MKKNYTKLLSFLMLVNLGLSATEEQNDIPEPDDSYYRKIHRNITMIQKYLYQQATDLLDIDLGVERAINRFKEDIRKQYPVARHSEGLRVRAGTDLCDAELGFVRSRMPKVSAALKNNFDIDTPLKIAFSCNGGGNRSMLVTLGFYLGAQDIGLLDATLYAAGVSGATWTIIPYSYLYATQGMSLTDFRNQLVHRLYKTMATVKGISIPPFIDESQKSVVINNIGKHFAYDQKISSIDVYSGFIGDYTLHAAGQNRLDVTWSSIADIIAQGDMPLPMGACVSYKTRESLEALAEYYWFEAGPFEVGSDQVQAYVPTSAFGSKFDQGRPVEGYAGNAPEYPISFYEGVFGSVFAFSLHEAMDKITQRPSFTIFGKTITLPIDLWIRSNMLESLRDARFAPATFYNYAYGLQDSPISESEQLRLYDGAMNFNSPLPLVMRPARQVDAIFVCDSDVDMVTLWLAQFHSQRNGIPFPNIVKVSKEVMSSQPLTVFNDPRLTDYDKNVVTILYCPFIKNEKFSLRFDPEKSIKDGFCNTFNFKYSKRQAELVVDLARYNVNSIKDEIKQVLQALAKMKQA